MRGSTPSVTCAGANAGSCADTEGVSYQTMLITTKKWTVTRPRPSHLASCRVRRAPRGLVFGHRGSVDGSTTAINISSVAISLAARSLFGSYNFLEDWLRNGIGLGLKLKDTNQK